MNHASLFTGIGGFDLAAEWMGWTNVFQVEIDEFCQKVLTKNFQQVKKYGDIKEFNGTEYAGHVDVLSGGFPCQPYSSAGKRLGKEDERHLWPEMLRVIGEVQPSYVVGENVYGLVNWSGGLVFNEVQTDLESIGYEVTPVILPACAKGAPHRRDRIWFVAYSEIIRRERQNRRINRCQWGLLSHWVEAWSQSVRCGEVTSNPTRERLGKERSDICRPPKRFAWSRYKWNAANVSSNELQRREIRHESEEGSQSFNQQPARRNQFLGQNWKDFPTQSPVCRRDDGVSNRVDRIKSLGNAIVPQVAYEIFKAIEEIKTQPL